ncbi:MAG: glycosyltransferase family 9 protein [Desulfobacca sp.]|nr:glycosyltransferase family 9 protein [Desulfobacca sp.]
MLSSRLVKRVLVWHRGALGDVLLSGPALMALAAHYPEARFTLLGTPSRLTLLAPNLPVEAIWDSQRADWAYLFMPETPLPERLLNLLADFDLAVIFSPQPRPQIAARLQEAKIRAVWWIPTFPTKDRLPVSRFQARHLEKWGVNPVPGPFRLIPTPEAQAIAQVWYETRGGTGSDSRPWVALAPGSGHRLKNWPLASYEELASRFQESLGVRVIWVAGPAEAERQGEFSALSLAPGQHLLFDLPLPHLAAYLERCQLYIGGDSGITHLAAVTRGPAVLALFGPTDPQIWSPPGPQVTVLSAARECAPCARAREIPCPTAACWEDLTVAQVHAAAVAALGA